MKSNFKKALIVYLIAALFYCYAIIIRVEPGIISSSLSETFNISKANLGLLSGYYFYSYIIFQIPAGIILDKYNTKRVISLAIGICLLANLIFSYSPNYNIACFSRVLMGIGSAFGFLGVIKLTSEWLPEKLFSSFISLAVFIGTIGGALTDIILIRLVDIFGWRDGNNIFTYVGVILFILAILFVKPKENIKPSNEKVNSSNQLKILFKIFSNYKFWITGIIGAILFIPINVLASLWGIEFIEAKLMLSKHDAAHMNGLIFIGTAFGCLFTSIVSAYITRYRQMLIWSASSLTIISLIIIYADLSQLTLGILLFLLGVSVGPQVLTFGIGKYFAPINTEGVSGSGINIINNLLGSILLPVFGFIISLSSTGNNISVENYQNAMIILPILTFLVIPMCIVIPKRIVGSIH